MNEEPKVKLAYLWEKTDSIGQTYFVGKLGQAKLWLFPARKLTAPGMSPEWHLYVQPWSADETRAHQERKVRQAAGLPERGEEQNGNRR